ncbi:motility associated factor glycosyltransferase family protein [Salinimonas iocasae]|uniref:Motility associated factor glycosyltransferase family protein n=1 Tax=Salinimonas iocasae TaxID=2572577 RepID=A0A5B7YF90_9ALTE|nr:6-hydroxymethylpterin diphosphokinase MptE-like protein [Salinimonas iocasae]QCZ94275.1 motility associated factor glycosyltransferase family protein [Salinimonas iocasae]
MDNLQASLLELEQKLRVAQDYQARQTKFAKDSEQRFQNNLAAFKTYYPELFKQISNFTPRQDFNVFASPSGDGNFVPRDATVPLYGDDPYQQSRRQVSKNTAKASFGRSLLYRGIDDTIKADKRLHIRHMAKLAKTLIDIVPEDEPLLESLPVHYPTCIMFGVGLGYALTALLESHTFDYIFVCEPDFEMFYASLFCTDWEVIFKKADEGSGCVFLHIGVTYDVFFEQVQQVYNDVGAFSLISSFCYQHTPGKQNNALIKAFFDHFHQIQLGYGFYNDAVTGLAHSIENFNDNQCPAFVGVKDKQKFKHLTAYVVANGPSVDEAIDVIRENRDNIILFAAGTALPTLTKLGIKPDFHVLVERPKVTYDILLETNKRETLKDLNLLAVDVMYSEVPSLYQWAGLGLKGPEAATVFSQLEYFKQHQQNIPELPFAGPLVANTALSFATMMGFGEIYMFGVDNGYPVDGSTHSSHSVYRDPAFKQKLVAETNAPFELEGNLGGHVKATSLLVQSKQQLEYLVKTSPHTQFYNVGHGAKITGAEPLQADDILCIPLKHNKQSIIEEIKSSFFRPFDIEKPEESVGIAEFVSLCDYLLEIGQRPYATRKEASDLLRAQARVVFAYRGRRYGHLFHVIKGTLLYFHGPMISLLYLYADEEKTLNWFAQALEVWAACIEAMKNDYRHAWSRRCDHSFEQHNKIRGLNESS